MQCFELAHQGSFKFISTLHTNIFYIVVEQCSLLREKLKMVLHIEENRVEMYASESATVLNVNAANISPLQIKVNIQNRKYNDNLLYSKNISKVYSMNTGIAKLQM